MIGPETQVIDAGGRYLVPGLCDGHMHVESGMVTVTEFAPRRDAARHHHDVHRSARDRQRARARRRAADARRGDGACRSTSSSRCRPACRRAPGLENAGRGARAEDVAEAMGWPNIIGLGEMMNFPGVVAGDPKMLGEIAATQAAGKTVGGHYASPDLGLPSRPMPRAGRRTTTRARARRTRSRACARACGRCCGWARPGTTSRRRSRR